MRITVLDHGYVEFIESWGHGREVTTDDAGRVDYEIGIIEAARQSTQGSSRGWAIDQKLLSTLFNNQPPHSTPFEFGGMSIEVQAPIFVFREWHRHRTQSYNEASARYAPLPALYYHADFNHVIERARRAAEDKNKQAGAIADAVLDEQRIEQWLVRDRELSEVLENHYQEGLAVGIPKELARKKMPVDHYSRMRASANLRNWLAFLVLRMDSRAQWEIRQYANAVSQLIANKFPQTWSLYCAQH